MPGPAYQRGCLLYDARRYAMAAEQFAKEVGENPKSGYGWSMLALSYLYDGKSAEAVGAARSAITAEPNLGYTHYVMATVMIRHKISNRRPSLPLGAFNSSRAASDYGDRIRSAFPPALESIRLNPQSAQFRALLAAMELDLNRPAEALMWANSGLELVPEHLACANIRAKALARIGNIESANETIDAALRVNPESASAHATKGWNLLNSGDAKQAAEAFANAARLDPTDIGFRNALHKSRMRKRWFLQPYNWLESRIGRIAAIWLICACIFAGLSFNVDDKSVSDGLRLCYGGGSALLAAFAYGVMRIRRWRLKRRAIQLGQWPPKTIASKTQDEIGQ